MSEYPTISEIVEVVASVTGIPATSIKSRKRTREITWARFLCLREARDRYSWRSLESIADSMGLGSHQTVMHGLKRAAVLMSQDPQFSRLAEEISRKLNPQPPALKQ